MAASALAPGGEPQKQHLFIIRDFAAEKYHGERTVSCLKGRLDDVVAASDAATAELEAAKRAREAAETELRGSQVQASIAPATIQALEATTSHLQEEIAKLGSDLEELKGCALEQGVRGHDEFISQMLEMNSRIRRFQQIASTELAGRSSELSEDGNQGKATDGHNVSDKNETAESEGMLTDLSDKVSNVVAEMHALEEEYQKDLLVHKKEFDPHTCTWSIVKTYGKPPVSRGGQSVTLVGTTLVVFGGEDAKRGLLNDLHILDLETMTWDVDAIRTPPAPRSDHDAACHAPAA